MKVPEMDADRAGILADAMRALVAAQDSANDGVRIVAGHAAVVLDVLDEVTRERDEARDESAALKASYDHARLALAAAQAELREAREALEKVWAAIGDALCSGTGIDKAYSQAVASEVRAFLSRPASDGALREIVERVILKTLRAAESVLGYERGTVLPVNGAAIVSEIMEGK